ncbi:MAG: hypothetical protein WAW61_15265, partial [Methylococcaceae bacterium]
MPFLLNIYRHIIHDLFIDRLIDKGLGQCFVRYEPHTYIVFLLSVAFLGGIRPDFAITLAIWILFLIVQISLLFFSLSREKRASLAASEKYIAVLFLISGFSALIYQVVWQRVLFTTFGVNSEAVTVIVSVFMFGLGIGALVGGYLQKKFPKHLLQLFLMLEISIGLFGLISLKLIHLMGEVSATESLVSLLLRVYSILAIPTLLMGATLPVLVAYLQNYFHNLGKSVGLLYAFNTIGSAIAAFLTVEMLFVGFGQQAAVIIAAICNFVTAYLIFNASRRLKAITIQAPVMAHTPVILNSTATHLPYPFVLISLLAIGYISLSQELLWFRLLGFMTANRPQVFGLLLTAFLIGIAWGSLKSKQICEQGSRPYRYLVQRLFYAAVIFYLAFPLVAYTTAYFGKAFGELLTFIAITIVACFT